MEARVSATTTDIHDGKSRMRVNWGLNRKEDSACGTLLYACGVLLYADDIILLNTRY